MKKSPPSTNRAWPKGDPKQIGGIPAGWNCNGIARKTKRLEKRLADLEIRFHRDPIIILEMPDGSKQELFVRNCDEILDLMKRAMREMEAGIGYSREVDMIRRSIGGTEKGGHMIELCRALLNSPATTDEEFSPITGSKMNGSHRRTKSDGFVSGR
jgi:hypothetical protein